MLKNYFLTALRTLRKNGSITSLNILGLSAGMTAAILIFLWVQNETSFDSYHPDVQNIYRITSRVNAAGWTWASTPPPLAPAIRATLPEVETVTSTTKGYNTILRINDELIFEKNSAYVDTDWFRIFHYDVVAGSLSEFIHNPYSLILTESKAKKYFGNKNPIGLFVHKDSLDYKIAAVIRDNPANSSFQSDILMPMQALMLNPIRRKQAEQWGGYSYLTFVKLRPTADPGKTARLITDILRKNKPADSKNYFQLTPLQAMHLESDVTHPLIAHGNRISVYIFSILGIFILLVACINYVNLTTARASLRGKEVGIRKLVGAERSGLFTQFLLESLLISALSLALTLALITAAMPFFCKLTDTAFHNPLASPQTWKIIGLTLLTATILNGIYPALLLSSFRPLNILKGAIILKFKDVGLRRGLVVLQFTFSILLIAGTIIIQRQLAYVQHTNPGYDRSQVFYFSLPYTIFQNKSDAEQTLLSNAVKTRLLAQTSISGATIASEPIVQVGNASSGGADWAGHDTSFIPTIYQISADEDYKNVLQLQLKQGRWFDPAMQTDKKNFVINETAAGELGIHKPVIGQWFIFQGDTGKIIGVVKDFHFASMHEKINPLVFYNHENTQTTYFVKTRPDQATTALAAAKNIYRQYVHDRPFDYAFLDEDFNAIYKTDAKVSSLILSFSILAILISCLGLLGLAAFTAQVRVREIGIRKVLGATVAGIVTLLSRDFIKLVFIAILIATPLAYWAMSRWLQSFAYHIPLNPWIFAGAGALALAIALLTVATQSIKAARANPVKNLRQNDR